MNQTMRERIVEHLRNTDFEPKLAMCTCERLADKILGIVKDGLPKVKSEHELGCDCESYELALADVIEKLEEK